MIRCWSEIELSQSWLERHRRLLPGFVTVLGFTETGLIEGISAAGATPEDRKITAIADAEFLYWGQNRYFPLPPLTAGASPVMITRSVVSKCRLPLFIFDSGLPRPATVPTIGLGGMAAKCLTTGQALPIGVVNHLWNQGLYWGKELSQHSYLVLSECVVGGTTTALAVLTALGIDARSKISSSHPECNHSQKWEVVSQGLARANLTDDPLSIVAGVGDPMQVVVAAMTIGCSQTTGVLLGGGSQMLAVYALARKLAEFYQLQWHPDRILVGTTKWITTDRSSSVVSLAQELNIPLVGTELNFCDSQYEALTAYEQGFVKEGVGAGASAIVSHLYAQWDQAKLLQEVETTLSQAVIESNNNSSYTG